jgi:hypothetical protein
MIFFCLYIYKIRFVYTGVDAGIYLIDAGFYLQVHRCRYKEFSLTQLPHKYMQVYCGRYIGATGDRLLKRHLQVDICRCRVADVKTQVGINFLKNTYNIFSKFLVGRQGSVD